jgi:cytochrome c-L
MHLPASWLLALAVSALAISGIARADKPVFTHPLDGAPIQVPLKPGEIETPALKQFKETGENPYRGDAAAVADGKALYEQWCQVCHSADATGNMGPALVGKNHIYKQTSTDVGMFSIIYAGASGAMQPFSKRDLTQDGMLKIIAYVRSLDK